MHAAAIPGKIHNPGQSHTLLHKLHANHATKLAPAAATQVALRNLTASNNNAQAHATTKNKTYNPCSTATSR